MNKTLLLKIAVMVLVPLLAVSLYYNVVLMNNENNNAPYTTIIPGRSTVVSGIGLGGLGAWNQGYELAENAIVVTGTGIVYAEPNITVISVRITTEAPMKTANEAYEYVVSRASQLVNALKNMSGVIEMRTVDFGLQPVYDYNNGVRIFRGYSAYYQLMITTSLNKTGGIVATIVEKGGNIIDSIYSTYPRQVLGKAYEQALEKALENAREKAETIAQKLGIKITGVRAVSLVSMQSYQPIQYSRVPVLETAKTSSLPPTPIETSEQPVTSANVIVVFNIGS